jgi:hypothetical protein
LALPKSVESGKLSLNKAGIRWMSVKIVSSHPPVIAAKLKEFLQATEGEHHV